MGKEKNPNLLSIIAKLAVAHINRLVNIFQLAGLEARLAIKTLINIIVLLFIMLFLAICTWFFFMLTIFYYLISIHFSAIFAAGILTILNFIFILLIGFLILKMKRNLFFPLTRKHIRDNHVSAELIE